VRSWLAGFSHLESAKRCGERIALGCGEIRFVSPDSVRLRRNTVYVPRFGGDLPSPTDLATMSRPAPGP